jgi:predicted nucleic acid-binding protein
LKEIVDTCVWSLSLRRRDKTRISAQEKQMLAQFREVIEGGRASIIGPIRQEILSGIKDRVQFAKVEELLEPFRDEEIRAADYVEAARLFNLCQNQGVQCGPVDILICAVALRKRYSIMTSDQGLKRCIEVLQAEGLMQ